MHIDVYSFGTMTVDAKVYRSDVIIFPDKVMDHWWRKEDHSLCLEDLAAVISFQPSLLIVGTGASGCMEIPAHTRRALEEQNISLIACNTQQAAQLFNEEINKNLKVAGAFHLTC